MLHQYAHVVPTHADFVITKNRHRSIWVPLLLLQELLLFTIALANLSPLSN